MHGGARGVPTCILCCFNVAMQSGKRSAAVLHGVYPHQVPWEGGIGLACTGFRSLRLGKIFPRSRRALDTAENSSREQQALLEYTRTACSMFHGTWCGFDRRSSMIDLISDSSMFSEIDCEIDSHNVSQCLSQCLTMSHNVSIFDRVRSHP